MTLWRRSTPDDNLRMFPEISISLTGFASGVVLIAVASLIPNLASAQSPQSTEHQDQSIADNNARRQLFQSVFGDPEAASEQPHQLYLFVDNQRKGIATMRAQADGSIAVRGKDILAAVRTLVTNDTIADVESATIENEFLDLSDLAAVGLEAEYNEQALTLFIFPAPARKTTREIALRKTGARTDARQRVVESTGFSAFANIRAGGSYLYNPRSNSTDRLPVSLTVQGAANLGHWTLESDFAYADRTAGGFRRKATRLVRDFPSRSVRAQAGDLVYPVSGFSGFQPLGGVGISRNFSLEPYRIVQPLGSQEFLLTSNSRVEVRQNGALTDELLLPAGSYNLTNFATGSGLNELELEITDATGETVTITDQVYFDERLLAKGIHEYSYVAGFPARSAGGKLKYDNDNLTAAFFHRTGITDSLTLGMNGYIDSDETLLGADANVGGVLGFLSTSLAASRNDIGESGLAARLSYRFLGKHDFRSKGRSFAASVLYQTARFRQGTDAKDNSVIVDAAMRYGQNVSDRFGFSTDARYAVRRHAISDSWTAGAGIFFDFTDALRLQSNFRHIEDPDFGNDNRLTLSLIYRFDDPSHHLRATLDTGSDNRQLEYSYLPDGFINEPSFNAIVSNRPDQTAVSVETDITSYLATARLSHTAQFAEGAGNNSQSTSISIGTAIAFVSGKFAIGRPITTGFAIFEDHETIDDLTIDLSYGGREKVGGLGLLRTALVPELAAYQNSIVTVSIPNLPAGFDAGPGTYRITPSYKGGALITIGTAATVLLDGTLVNSAGEPLALQAGEIVAVDRPDPALQFFTNRTGRFRIFGLRPTHYVMKIYSQPDIDVEIEIPVASRGIVRFGSVTLE